MLTMFDDDDSVFAAMRAGARGYVLKGAQQDEIVRAIQAVAAGEAIFGPGIARRVLGLVAAPPAASEPFPGLTGREREVLGLIAAGARNAEIARQMSIAPKTVANHISAIFTKLQVADRSEAIILARDAGLGRDTGRSPRPGHGPRPASATRAAGIRLAEVRGAGISSPVSSGRAMVLPRRQRACPDWAVGARGVIGEVEVEDQPAAFAAEIHGASTASLPGAGRGSRFALIPCYAVNAAFISAFPIQR